MIRMKTLEQDRLVQTDLAVLDRNLAVNCRLLPLTDRQEALMLRGILRNTLLEDLRCGYGRCSSSGCYCQKYEGNASTCQNSGCGHSYGDHW